LLHGTLKLLGREALRGRSEKEAFSYVFPILRLPQELFLLLGSVHGAPALALRHLPPLSLSLLLLLLLLPTVWEKNGCHMVLLCLPINLTAAAVAPNVTAPTAAAVLIILVMAALRPLRGRRALCTPRKLELPPL